MRVHVLAIALLAWALASCAECKAPEGCLSTDRVEGACQCTEWQVVSVENVPVKFVVVSVRYEPPGARSRFCYGDCPSRQIPGHSEVGSRWRSVIRAPDGSEKVAALGRLDVGDGGPHVPLVAGAVTATSGSLNYGPQTGLEVPAQVDLPSKERDSIEVWVNPVATVITDYADNRTVDWAWSASCFGIACQGAMTLTLTAGEIAGTTPPVGSDHELFLATLTADERAATLRYHPLYDPPGRDPATLAEDPRFMAFGPGTVWHWPVFSGPPGPWTPCDGTLSDAAYPVLAQMEVPFGNGALVVQHSVQSISATCEAQQPGGPLSGSDDCQIGSTFYIDRVFGTVLAVPPYATMGTCTGP